MSGNDATTQAAERWRLTRRQAEVLTLLCRGKSNKEIAHALGVALPTVVSHVGAILRSSASPSRTAVVAKVAWFARADEELLT